MNRSVLRFMLKTHDEALQAESNPELKRSHGKNHQTSLDKHEKHVRDWLCHTHCSYNASWWTPFQVKLSEIFCHTWFLKTKHWLTGQSAVDLLFCQTKSCLFFFPWASRYCCFLLYSSAHRVCNYFQWPTVALILLVLLIWI